MILVVLWNLLLISIVSGVRANDRRCVEGRAGVDSIHSHQKYLYESIFAARQVGQTRQEKCFKIDDSLQRHECDVKLDSLRDVIKKYNADIAEAEMKINNCVQYVIVDSSGFKIGYDKPFDLLIYEFRKDSINAIYSYSSSGQIIALREQVAVPWQSSRKNEKAQFYKYLKMLKNQT